jgi:hypothetical protein
MGETQVRRVATNIRHAALVPAGLALRSTHTFKKYPADVPMAG